ncbi:hypothetical protein SAMN02745121_02461 [Nannocystis exedens]|uniref:2OG-Fe(II) oxygenase superfamily protein n=1 Tax=Nannocystis exedens TaxID=54 RepID=A0A1I1WKK2_9BACT|nr:hypothetical protein [Nannocystis exedens]PCC67825.1 hypothetical protein NAEX_00833 [Nannocystis exedens]SFD95754.1 hypothetical protein SAMN02745121_02461 [Nannocystis exedens]
MTGDRGDDLRDRFFALHGLAAAAREEAERRLLADVEGLEAEPTTRLMGLPLSPFPTARFKRLRFVAADALDEAVRGRFARPCPALPELAAAFVDPEEFGYHCCENVVGLDRLFAGLEQGAVRFTGVTWPGSGVTSLRAQVSSALGARLAELDALGLYVKPADRSRGGLRFIFHAAELAAALTVALRDALPPELLRGFVHVNPVFRCNRFEPGDAPFAAHVDSPYFDRARHHVSKYTLLLYLTPGRGDAPLRFVDGPAIAEIEAMTAFVFAQGLAHEGRPYVDGRKVFLRTELVFEEHEVEHAAAIGEVFAKACYLDGESVFAAELAASARAAYERAAAAHWRGPPEPVADEPYLHKQFRGAHFVTNGFDYWFSRAAFAPVEAAALALLDLLNAWIDGSPFRRLCQSQVVVRGASERGWIAELLRAQAPAPEPVFARLNKPALCPEPEAPLRHMNFPSSPDFHDPFPEDWDATRHEEVIAVYARARRWALRRIAAAPITMLGKELFLDPARFVVEGDRIHVLSRERLGPVHFAGAVFFQPEDFVGVDVTLAALHPLVPPIAFHEEGETLHLRCDLFRNSWMVSHRHEAVPVPRVRTDEDVAPESAAWLRAAELDLDRLRAETDDPPPPAETSRRR